MALALAAGVGSALAYGAGTAAQHAAAYTGEVDAGRLADLLRNPRWLAGTAGDVLGIVLQLIALGNGPVVWVQPLLVLSLPVAVIIRWWLGAPRPTWRDLRHCLLLILALVGFFALIGQPHRGRIVGTAAAGWTSGAVFVAGLLLIAAVWRRGPVTRSVVFGTVAGAWFGVVSVLIEAVSSVWEDDGIRGFQRPEGLVPLASVVVLAVVGYLLVQVGFQLGHLGASFPPNLVGDPVVAVVLGAALLGEAVPLGPAHLLGYAVCIAVVGFAAVRLADPGHAGGRSEAGLELRPGRPSARMSP
jgi:hypothetical protein